MPPPSQDSLVYLLNREQHTVGQRTQASKPSISLSAPDILPLHCTIRRLRASWHRSEEKLVLEPIASASVSVNFSAVTRTVVLRHGDLLSLGLYYLLLYKDPMKAQPLPAQTLLRLRALHPEGPSVCGTCGSLLKEQGGPNANRQSPEPTDGPRAPRRRLQLEFEPEAEDVLLRRIMTLIEPGGDDHKLTPAFLLCLCIQHSATSFQPGDFGQLLLKAAKMIQRTVWVSWHRGVGTMGIPSALTLVPVCGDALSHHLCSLLLSLPRSAHGSWPRSNPSSKCHLPLFAPKLGEFSPILPPTQLCPPSTDAHGVFLLNPMNLYLSSLCHWPHCQSQIPGSKAASGETIGACSQVSCRAGSQPFATAGKSGSAIEKPPSSFLFVLLYFGTAQRWAG